MRRPVTIGVALVAIGLFAVVLAVRFAAPRGGPPVAIEPPAIEPEVPKPPDPPTAPPVVPTPRLDQYGDPLPPGMLCRIGANRFRSNDVRRIAFSADGSAVLTADAYGIRSWDARTGRDLPPRETALGGFWVTFTPYGDLFGDFWFWNLAQPLPRPLPVPRQLNQPARLIGAASDGTRGVFAWWNKTVLWDLVNDRFIEELTARPPRDLDIHVPPAFERPYRADVFFSRDGRSLIVHTGMGLSVHRSDTGAQMRLIPMSDHKGAFAVSGDMKFAATANDSKAPEVHVWNLATGELARTIPLEGKGYFGGLYFSPDGTRLVGTADGRITVWAPAEGRELGQFRGQSWESASELAFSPDGRTFAVATGAGVRLHDTDTAAPRYPVPGWDERFGMARLSADGKRVITTRMWPRDDVKPRETAGLRVWDAETGRLLEEPDAPFPPARTLSHDGSVLAGLTPAGEVQVWDVTTRTHRCTLKDVPKNLSDARLTGDGRWLTGLTSAPYPTQPNRFWWDARTGDRLPALAAKGDELYLVPMPSRRYVLGDARRFIDVIDPAGAKPVRLDYGGAADSQFVQTPDGKTLLCCTRGPRWRRWDLTAGRELAPIDFPEFSAKHPHQLAVGKFAFLPDGNRFVNCDYNGFTLWDLANKKLLKTWKGDDSYRWDLAVSADGKRVMAKGNYSVAVWDLDTIPDAP